MKNTLHKLILIGSVLFYSVGRIIAIDYPHPQVNFLPYGSSRLLNITGFGDGSKLNTWIMNGEDNEDWRIWYVSDGVYEIENVKTGKYITQEDCYVVLGKKNNDDNQRWNIVGVDKDYLGEYLYYKIVNVETGDALTFLSAGNVITTEQYKGKENQKWKINLDGLEGFCGNCKVKEGEKASAIGGLLGPVVVVNTVPDFVEEIKSDGPKIVVVGADLDLNEERWNQRISSYKTIIGSYGNSTLTDPILRSDGQFADYDPSNNVVLQNLSLRGTPNHNGDIFVNIYSAKNWWVDHCTFVATEVGMDSAYHDVGKFIWINTPYPDNYWTRPSEVPICPDYVTLSYNIFRDRYWAVAYGTQNGNIDEDRTSVMFNTFEGCVRRMVQLGNGTLHEYCNFINRTHTAGTGDGLACIIVGDGGQAYLEQNRFQGMRKENSGYNDQEILGDLNTTDVGSYTDYQQKYVDGQNYIPHAINHKAKSESNFNPKDYYGYTTTTAYSSNGKDTKGFCSAFGGRQTSDDKFVYINEKAASDYVLANIPSPFLINTGITDPIEKTEETAIIKQGSGSSSQTLEQGRILFRLTLLGLEQRQWL